MSIRSNQMTAVQVVAGLYPAPAVRFGRGNQILQIRNTAEVPVEDLEAEVLALTDVATAQNTEVNALYQQVITLYNSVEDEATNEALELNQVPTLQSQLDQINTLIQNSEQDNFQPYFASYMPNQVYKGAGNVNDTFPDSKEVYSFTPSEGNDGVFYNYPTILFSLTLPTYTTSVLYQFSVSLCMMANNVVYATEGTDVFVKTTKAVSNGGIIFFTITNPLANNQVIYSSQTGSVGLLPAPGTFTGGSALTNFTDVVSIPANTPNVYLSLFISTHYSMTLSNTAYNQSQYYVSDKGWSQGTGYGGALPVLTMVKL
jgi:hypothetical protein